jgi:hypothetical protein
MERLMVEHGDAKLTDRSHTLLDYPKACWASNDRCKAAMADWAAFRPGESERRQFKAQRRRSAAIGAEAFEAIERTRPLRGRLSTKRASGNSAERDLHRLRLMRGPGESYSDVILRIVAAVEHG